MRYTVSVRLTAFFVFLFPATSAFAIVPPGPPPWHCLPIEACNAENICAPLYGLPLGFDLRDVQNEKNKFALKGYNGAERIVLLLPNMEAAKRVVETDRWEGGVSIVLIPNDRVADAHGFWAHSVIVRGTGKRFVSKDKILIACASARKG